MDFEETHVAGATFSPDRRYPYALWRQWSAGPPARTISWVLLNPSTADATKLDPTLCRCRNFSKRWGFHRMHVVNLYAFRHTNPAVMRAQADPIGPHNVAFISQFVAESDLCIAAWGGNVMHAGRLAWLHELVDPIPIHVLGFTSTGELRHPLYLRNDCAHTEA
jgi:hypothetical protein